MVIKSYLCKHIDAQVQNNLTPISVAQIHKFGALNQSSNESMNFRNDIAELINGNICSKYKFVYF